MQLSIFSLEEHPAKTSRSPDSEREWMASVATSRLSMVPLLAAIGPRGWFGKTSPASFRATKDETLQAFWDCSPGAGSKSLPAAGNLRELSKATQAHTASHGECLTLSLSEWTGLAGLSLNDEGVCSLSDILVTGDVPPRYFLSAKACAGILRRAGKRGKALPQMLRQALSAVAGAWSEPAKREDKMLSLA